MRGIVFVVLVSIASRVLWSKKYPFQNLRSEVNFMGLIIIFNILWFSFCNWAWGFEFP